MNYKSLAIALAVIGIQAIQIDAQDEGMDWNLELAQTEADADHFTHYGSGLAQMEDVEH